MCRYSQTVHLQTEPIRTASLTALRFRKYFQNIIYRMLEVLEVAFFSYQTRLTL
jgi:hypothetical protein